MNFFCLSLGRYREHSAFVRLLYNEHTQQLSVMEMQRVVHEGQQADYATVVSFVARKVIETMPAGGGEHGPLLVDVTGVGSKTLSLFRDRDITTVQYTIDPTPVFVTADREFSRIEGAGGLCIPRRDIESTLTDLFSRNQLHFHHSIEALQQQLKESLADFIPERVYLDGSSQVWRAGENDDKLLALGIACWYVQDRIREVGE